MELTRHRELQVRMAEYETYKFSARVRATHNDLGYSDADLLDEETDLQEVAKKLQDLVAEQLDLALESDIQDAVDMTTDRKSFLRRAYASANTPDKDK